MPVGPQARVDLIELAGTRLHRQQVDEPAYEAAEEQGIIKRLLAISDLGLAV